jgi:perosamine synthetase
MSDSSQSIKKDFIKVLHEVLGIPKTPLSLHEPHFSGNEWLYVKECIDTSWVSSGGKYVDEFEQRLAEYTGSRYAIAVVNGTAALHIALLLAGVRAGDEVLVPALSFVATANAVAHCGAIPHFIDSNESTLGVDPFSLERYLEVISERSLNGLRNKLTGRRIAAVVPMHVFGHPVDMNELVKVAKNFEIPIVEDAAEALGSTFAGRHMGTFGLLGVLSFNGNKVITTGGGGALLTDDEEIALSAKHLTTTAKQKHPWDFYHDSIAFNYRLPNINAALGCAQLENISGILEKKRILARAYQKAFDMVSNFSFISEPQNSRSNYWLNAVRFRPPNLIERNELLSLAHENGFQCRPVWRLLNSLPMFQECPHADLEIAKKLEISIINLPSSPMLADVLL